MERRVQHSRIRIQPYRGLTDIRIRKLPLGKPALQDPDADAFYSFFLRVKIREADFQSSKYLVALAAAANGRGLTGTASEAVLAFFDDSAADIRRATACLEEFITLHGLDRTHLVQIRQTYEDKKPGTRALLWLLNLEMDQKVEILQQLHFIRSLMFCVVAERAEDMVWKWLLLDRAPLDVTESFQVNYKAHVLISMMDAQAFWADPAGPLQAAWQTLIDVFDAGVTGPRMPISATSVWFSKAMRTKVRHSLPATTYTRFNQMTRAWIRDEVLQLYYQGWSDLTNPHQQNPRLALQCLRRCEKQDSEGPLIPGLVEARLDSQLRMFIWRTAQALARKGDLDNARWVLDLGRRHLPEQFALRKPTEPGETRHRRKATLPELNRGRTADAEGYVVDDRLSRDWYKAVTQLHHESDAKPR